MFPAAVPSLLPLPHRVEPAECTSEVGDADLGELLERCFMDSAVRLEFREDFEWRVDLVKVVEEDNALEPLDLCTVCGEDCFVADSWRERESRVSDPVTGCKSLESLECGFLLDCKPYVAAISTLLSVLS